MKRSLIIRRGAGESAGYETYVVELEDGATLLDALEYLRTGTVPDLIYRHSCHHGSCGTCAVRLDGAEVLACLTPLASLGEGDALPVIEPLRTFEPYADLAVDPGRLFDSLPKDASKLRASEWVDGEQIPEPAGGVSGAACRPDGIDRFVRFEDCIECGACMSACPVEEPFVGPASLAALRRELLKNPGRRDELLAIAARSDAVAACRRHFACSKVCPRHVYPGKHIELLRKELAKGSS